MDAYELDGIVEEIYGRAGAGPDDAWTPTKLARALGVQLEREVGLPCRGVFLPGPPPTIRTRSGLPRAIEEWTRGHELGHMFGIEAWHERECDYVGAALQMRRRPFLRALAQHGDAWHVLARLFGVTSTSAALRAAELEGRALAVVTPQRVYPRAIYLPDRAIRTLALHGGPGIVRAPLEDDRKRIVLEAELVG